MTEMTILAATSCEPIEFTDGVTFLYRLYDADGCLLRVGITSSLPRRMAEYAEEAWWWDDVTRKTAQFYTSRKEAMKAETAAIRAEHPVWNVRDRCNVQLTATQLKRREWFLAKGFTEGQDGSWTRSAWDIPEDDRGHGDHF